MAESCPAQLIVSGRQGYNETLNGVYNRGEADHDGKVYYKHATRKFVIRWYAKKGVWFFDHRGLNTDHIACAAAKESTTGPHQVTKIWRVYDGSQNRWVRDPNVTIQTIDEVAAVLKQQEEEGFEEEEESDYEEEEGEKGEEKVAEEKPEEEVKAEEEKVAETPEPAAAEPEAPAAEPAAAEPEAPAAEPEAPKEEEVQAEPEPEKAAEPEPEKAAEPEPKAEEPAAAEPEELPKAVETPAAAVETPAVESPEPETVASPDAETVVSPDPDDSDAFSPTYTTPAVESPPEQLNDLLSVTSPPPDLNVDLKTMERTESFAEFSDEEDEDNIPLLPKRRFKMDKFLAKTNSRQVLQTEGKVKLNPFMQNDKGRKKRKGKKRLAVA